MLEVLIRYIDRAWVAILINIVSRAPVPQAKMNKPPRNRFFLNFLTRAGGQGWADDPIRVRKTD